jgi:hypothetical protein
MGAAMVFQIPRAWISAEAQIKISGSVDRNSPFRGDCRKLARLLTRGLQGSDWDLLERIGAEGEPHKLNLKDHSHLLL